ncbi:response regulator transcription factor [Romboutsia sp. Marseille-P6047]|uniref:response regulator transcription factor n=1 Tax=Romboutsia sp. Marseille-P6047 TaxID=2161817 RepID=UPI000F04570F|nr:response regulator [Romboutsia sp. Marseille-P6047]
MLNILVVEDEAPIRDWIAYTVDNISEEFKVLASASNGKEAYELAVKFNPQVIISDIKMPIMGGIELTKEVKKVMPDTYIILLTNYAEFSYAKQAISCGVHEYLIKSDIRPKELKDVLTGIYENIKDSNNSLNTTGTEVKNNYELDENKYSKAIAKSMEYIELNYKESISLGEISKHVYLSPEYFSRLFKEEVGENFSTYLTLFRMKKAEELLKNTNMKICQISNEVGYVNSSYFSKTYKKYKGVSPEDDRY